MPFGFDPHTTIKAVHFKANTSCYVEAGGNIYSASPPIDDEIGFIRDGLDPGSSGGGTGPLGSCSSVPGENDNPAAHPGVIEGLEVDWIFTREAADNNPNPLTLYFAVRGDATSFNGRQLRWSGEGTLAQVFALSGGTFDGVRTVWVKGAASAWGVSDYNAGNIKGLVTII